MCHPDNKHQFSCHHLYKNITHKPFSPSAALCTIPMVHHGHHALQGTAGKEHGAQVKTGRNKVKGPCMNWCLSSGTSVSLKTQMSNNILLQILTTVTALPMAEQSFQVGEVVLKLAGMWEGMLSRSSVVRWHHTFTEVFSSPCVFKGEATAFLWSPATKLLPSWGGQRHEDSLGGYSPTAEQHIRVTWKPSSTSVGLMGAPHFNQWPSHYGYG